MSNLRITNSTNSNFTDNFENVDINSAEQDVAGNNYTPDWSKWYGYYKVIPELQAVIDKKSIWTIGRGYEAKDRSKRFLERIKGNGKDTFNTIIQNMIRQYTICGDAFAEIVWNKRSEVINIKPLNPGSMTIVSSEKGIIKGYIQNNYNDGSKIKFNKEDIFHLPWNRLGDECHGISTIEKIQSIVESRNEAMSDMRTVFHRYVAPINIWKLDTDDATEIATFKTKIETTYKNKENIFIPMNTVEVEKVSIPQHSTLDPLPWIKTLNKYFIMSEGVPETILGHGEDTTEATSKILYLAFQQMVEWNQLFLEEQIKLQMGLDVEFNFPASIEPALTEEKSKERKTNNLEMKHNAVK